ncbi:MAG: response regulator transcription factor [Firmicutes bacterium]|nr:response regulator transcription factor [Bacillota bacterium]
MKIAICDDDKNELFRILSVLADYQTQRNIEFSYKPFDNSTELASNLLQEHYDIYLLDVVMPGLNGIELAKEIRSSDKAADIIFLTSSPEFAVESYTVKASNYLVKPVSRDRLVEALDDIMRTRTEDRDSCLVLKSSVGVHKVHISEIIYIEASNRKVIYYLRNTSQITCVEKFASVCDQLLQHPEFLLAHRSFLVNMNYIRRISEIKRLYLAFQMEESI